MLVELIDQGAHFGDVIVILRSCIAGDAALCGGVNDSAESKLESGRESSTHRLVRSSARVVTRVGAWSEF